MKYAIPLIVAGLLLGAAAGASESVVSHTPCKHFVWDAHGGHPAPQASCLQQTETEAEAARTDAAFDRWPDVDRDIAAVVSDEHQVEMNMPASPTIGEQRALTGLRTVVFTLASAGSAHDRGRTVQATQRVRGCCLALDGGRGGAQSLTGVGTGAIRRPDPLETEVLRVTRNQDTPHALNRAGAPADAPHPVSRDRLSRLTRWAAGLLGIASLSVLSGGGQIGPCPCCDSPACPSAVAAQGIFGGVVALVAQRGSRRWSRKKSKE